MLKWCSLASAGVGRRAWPGLFWARCLALLAAEVWAWSTVVLTLRVGLVGLVPALEEEALLAAGLAPAPVPVAPSAGVRLAFRAMLLGRM